MRCKWKDITEPDADGKRRVECVRCGQKSNPTANPHHKIHATCKVWGWGDYVAAFFARLGITKGYISQLTGRDCGCRKRQEQLNTLGERVRRWLSG